MRIFKPFGRGPVGLQGAGLIGQLTAKLKRLGEMALQVPILGVLIRAGLGGFKGHAKDMAASIAFFGLLSLFPLILGLVAMASSILKSEQLRNQVVDWVNEFFPVGSESITQNIESLIHLRGAAGLVSILTLFWAASKMVGAISRGINRALDLKRSHAFYLSSLRNFALIVTISILMFSVMAVLPFADLLSDLELSVLGSRASKFIDLIGGQLASLLTTSVMIAMTYALVPYRRPAWPDLLPGLMIATLLIELGKRAFVFYVNNVSKLDALYGSISSVIVLMLWLYFFAQVLLFGAEVIRVLQLERQESAKTHLDPPGHS
ncbi:MAG: YihY/virulence factor BrkB family protein [Thermodesulfobacteriota bacterium]